MVRRQRTQFVFSPFDLLVVAPGKIPRSCSGDELRATVDVVGRSCQGRVRHEVHGEGGDVGGSDDTPDGEHGA